MSVDTSTADPLIGTVLDGRYRLDARIARGGMATVYEAFDTRLDRSVAVKVMHASLADDDAFVDRFRREAKSAARLSHPSVVAIYDQGEDAGRVYLVMEHVAGRTLRELLREHGRLPAAQALDVTAGVLAALAAAHAAGLVHRDVKPENVLVTADGVKVADFGLARAIEATNHTVVNGTLLGTVAYLAPEQVVTGAADPRTDLYALGVVLFEMLTGTVPFTGDTPLAVAYRHVNEDVPEPSSVTGGIPRVVDNLVRAATRRDPDERYPDAQSMLSAVQRARSALGNADTAVVSLHDAPTLVTQLPPGGIPAAGDTKTRALPAVPPAPPPVQPLKKRSRPGRRRLTILVALAAAILLVSGVGGWWLATGTGTEVPVAPTLVGLTRDAAFAQAREAGIDLREGPAEHSDDVPAGSVAKQDPAPGTRLGTGAVVTIHVSLGVRMVEVPKLAGLTEKQARDALRKADLGVGTVRKRFHETVPEGRVIEASSPAGASLKHDSKVSFVLSDGPAPVDVPDVRGRPVGDAIAALRAAGLNSAVVTEFSDSVPKDRVIAQSPASGKAERDSMVTLRVSKGPQTVRVPDVRGADIDDATAQLRALGLTVDVQHVRHGRGDVVLDQDPPPGTVVRVGTRVTLVAF